MSKKCKDCADMVMQVSALSNELLQLKEHKEKEYIKAKDLADAFIRVLYFIREEDRVSLEELAELGLILRDNSNEKAIDNLLADPTEDCDCPACTIKRTLQ